MKEKKKEGLPPFETCTLLPDRSTISEPQHQEIGEFYVILERRSIDHETPK